MLTADQKDEQLLIYRRRLDDLYGQARSWIGNRYPDAVISESTVPVSEETTGPYATTSLDIVGVGARVIRFFPRGIFMVGAQGRVDVRSRVGGRTLVWVWAGGPQMTFTGSPRLADELAISHPLFPGVPQGWAWTDDRHNRLLHLDESVFWEHVLTPLMA